MKIKIGTLLAAVFAVCLTSSHGQTVNWIGSSGNWNLGTNWSSGGVPNSSETALFSNSGTTGSLSLNAPQTIGAFSMTRTTGQVIIQMNPDNLTINGNLITQAGSQNLTFRNGGFLSVGGDMTVASGVFLGSRANSGATALIGGVSVAGTTSLSSTLEFTNFSTTVNLGALAMNTGGLLNLTSGASPNGTADGATNLISVTRLSGAAGTIQANKSGTTGHLSVSGTVNGSYSGTIVNGSGNVQLSKSGSSTLTLAGANTYTGATAITAGTLLITGSLGNTAVAVSGTGVLGGTGTIGGAVTVNSGGQLAPGTSPGRLTVTNSVTLTTGSAASFEINGATAGTNYDQLRLTGASSVFSLTGDNNLVLSLGYIPVSDQLFFLVDNQGNSAIGEIFERLNGITTNLAQDSIFTIGLQQFKIGYQGNVLLSTFNGGNDLVLQAIPEPSVSALLAGGLTLLVALRRRRI